jgi:glycosyltransferase involved in cell wall biosynthesis
MIVNHLNTMLDGGAATAARRLHESLLAAGVRSRFWYSHRANSGDPPPRSSPLPWPRGSLPAVVRRLQIKWDKLRYINGRSPEFEIFTDARRTVATPFDLCRVPGDILQLHWIANWLDYPSFFASIPEEMPIVWTLHDMNPFTGGCHFSSGCEAFSAQCGHCPQLVRKSKNDLSRRSFALKRQSLRRKNLHIVAPSRWLADAARRSHVFSAAQSFRTIPYGLDTETFAPRSPVASRAQLGLPAERLVLAFGAVSLSNGRKGMRALLQALSKLDSTRPWIGIYFGEGDLPMQAIHGNELRGVGYLQNNEQLTTFYSAADLFLLPSLEDNLPQTGLEAMACGTPVVGFDVGGIPDYTRPGQTGLLARAGDAGSLARQIGDLIEQPQSLRRMGENARRLIKREFSQTVEVDGYRQLYHELLGTGLTHLQAA